MISLTRGYTLEEYEAIEDTLMKSVSREDMIKSVNDTLIHEKILVDDEVARIWHKVVDILSKPV